MSRKLLMISVLFPPLLLCACDYDPGSADPGWSPEAARARCEEDEGLVMDAERFTVDVALECVVCYGSCGEQCAASSSSGMIAYTCPPPPPTPDQSGG